VAYVKYTGLTTANSILAKMSEYATSAGWTVLADCVDDLDVILRSINDGKRLTLRNPNGTLFAHLRTANGYQIFPKQANGISLLGATQLPTINHNLSGIGLTCSSGFSSINKWYDQDNVPRYKNVNGDGDVIGVGAQTWEGEEHTLYCNVISTPTDMIIFTIQHGDLFQHLVFGNLNKFSTWSGGIVFSGSMNSYNMFANRPIVNPTVPDSLMSPIFSTDYNSNSFLRIDMGDAPNRGNIRWASSGSNVTTDAVCYTGKQLAFPIRTSRSMVADIWTPKIINWGFVQSQAHDDSGINCNTLNCITVDLPLFFAVIVDPDDLREFAPVGIISGFNLVSLYNMSEASTYEISYPTSGILRQVFPFTALAGEYGYDGISIEQ